jgi:hypothetical protein
MNNEKLTYCSKEKLNLGQVTLACATVSTFLHVDFDFFSNGHLCSLPPLCVCIPLPPPPASTPISFSFLFFVFFSLLTVFSGYSFALCCVAPASGLWPPVCASAVSPFFFVLFPFTYTHSHSRSRGASCPHPLCCMTPCCHPSLTSHPLLVGLTHWPCAHLSTPQPVCRVPFPLPPCCIPSPTTCHINPLSPRPLLSASTPQPR